MVALGGGAVLAWTQWGDSLFSGEPVKPAAVARTAAPPRPASRVTAPPAVTNAAPVSAPNPPPAAPPPAEPAEPPVKAAPAPSAPAAAAEPQTPEATPAPRPAPASARARSAKETGYWTVSRGETLYGISVETGVDLWALSSWNGLDHKHVIHPGQRLRLTPPPTAPDRQKTAAAAAAPARKAGTIPAPAPVASADSGANAVMDKRVKPFSPREKAEAEYRHAADLLQQGRLGDAEKHLRQALVADGTHTAARELLAGLMLQQGHWREAQEILEQGIDAVPAHYPFAQLLARVHVEHGADHEALAVMERNRRAAADNPDYLAFLAALYQRAGRHDDAVKAYREVTARNPREGRWWLGLGISLEAVLDRDAAAEAYERAIQSGVLDDKLLHYARQRLAVLKRQ